VKTAAALALLSLFVLPALADEAPPRAEVREVTDTYYGTTVADPYRWMEDKGPEFGSWLKAQAAYARAKLDAFPERAALLKRIDELSESVAEVSVARREGKAVFYYKLAPGQNERQLYMRASLTAPERLLVDPASLDKEGVHYSVMSYSVSDDGRYLSYTVAPGGSELGEIRVMEIATGRDLGERIDRVRGWAGSWLPDNRSFAYRRERRREPGEPAAEERKRSRNFLHVLGTNPDEDKPLLGYAVDPAIEVAPALFPFVWPISGSRWAIGELSTGVSPNSAYYIAPVSSLKDPVVPWRRVAGFEDEVRWIYPIGDELYVLTFKGAPRSRIVLTSAKEPDLATAKEVLPQGRAVIQRLQHARDGLYVTLLDGGLSRLLRIDPKTKLVSEIRLPYEGTIFDRNSDWREPGLLIGMTSWVKPPAYFLVDAKGTAREVPIQPRFPLDVSGYESREVTVPSYDGTLIPLSIVHKRGLARDGVNPTLLMGYGAYGFTTDPRFSAPSLAWLERGGMLAFAHVRGGGAFGREWHLAGQKLTKPNTWKDFIACAEYLIREKYANQATIAGTGRSAGGILMGNALAERPELFAAAVINVGVMNMLRFEHTTNGPANIPEFGSVTSEDGFRGLLAMDAYTKVKDGTPYPAVLLTHGINDPRVEPWQSAKYAARLQAASSSGRPIWLRVEYDAGHGFGSTKRQRNEELADTYAFLFAQLKPAAAADARKAQ
jgi:prolyl oligopeptidase